MGCIQRFSPLLLRIGQPVGIFEAKNLINKGKIIGIGKFAPRKSPQRIINVVCIEWQDGSQSSLNLKKCHKIFELIDD
jgi:hypothetical protein